MKPPREIRSEPAIVRDLPKLWDALRIAHERVDDLPREITVFVRKRFKWTNLTDDLVQEAYTELLNAIQIRGFELRYVCPAHSRMCFFSLVRTICNRLISRCARRNSPRDLAELASNTKNRRPNALTESQTQHLRNLIDRSGRLTNDDKTLIRLKFFYEKTYRQIAKQMQIEEHTARRQIKQALVELRKDLLESDSDYEGLGVI